MTAPLSHEEHLEVLACIHELHRCRTLAAFPEHALRALATLIPSNLSAFNEVNMPRGRILAITDRHLENHEELSETWERLSGEHPLVRYVAETGDGQAIKFSDFLSEDDYHRLDLYRAFYRMLDAEDQLSVTIRSDEGVIIALAFNRDRRSFTESERVKLNLVRPHILQAYANVEELAGHVDEKRDLQTALRETGHGLIALDRDDRVAHATPGAPECLTRFFPDAAALDGLPPALADWLASDPTTPFVLHGRNERLIVRSPHRTHRRLLLLSEERLPQLPDRERLTAREVEVLAWVAQGKSNAAIAVILGLAAGTVKLHVQRILDKLGVENRTAATVVARTHGLIPTPRT
jgi:DNA-binding CsgD family transcriptional regulator